MTVPDAAVKAGADIPNLYDFTPWVRENLVAEILEAAAPHLRAADPLRARIEEERRRMNAQAARASSRDARLVCLEVGRRLRAALDETADTTRSQA